MNFKKLATVAVLMSGVVLAAPSFAFVKDAKMNMMMGTMGGKEVIELAAAPGMKLLARNVAANHAVFVYAGKDAKAVFSFYEKALLGEGWKAAGMMGKDAMAGDTMAKDAMGDKKDGATMTPEQMAKDKEKDKMAADAMGKDTMAGDAMMKKGLEEKFSFKGHNISLKVISKTDRVEADLNLN